MFTGSVSNANIEEDKSVMKKDLKSFEVAELETTPKQNLDRNAHFNGNNYETVIFIVLGLCLAFIVFIIVSLAIYFYSRKKFVNSIDHNPPIQRPGNELEPLDYEVSILFNNCSDLL